MGFIRGGFRSPNRHFLTPSQQKYVFVVMEPNTFDTSQLKCLIWAKACTPPYICHMFLLGVLEAENEGRQIGTPIV